MLVTQARDDVAPMMLVHGGGLEHGGVLGSTPLHSGCTHRMSSVDILDHQYRRKHAHGWVQQCTEYPLTLEYSSNHSSSQSSKMEQHTHNSATTAPNAIKWRLHNYCPEIIVSIIDLIRLFRVRSEYLSLVPADCHM